MTTQESPPRDVINEFVMVSHGNFDRSRKLLEQYPHMIDVPHDMTQETALGAASHVGNREIAEYLLSQGANQTIVTAGFLGRRAEVAQFLDDDPAKAKALGAHGISLMFHVAQSGDVDIAQLVLERGGEIANDSLHGAVKFGHVAMVDWLIEHDANLNAKDFMGQTPLESAVKLGHDAVADMLRNAMVTEDLPVCEHCGEAGYRYISSVDGSTMGEHTVHFTCKHCGESMGERHSGG